PSCVTHPSLHPLPTRRSSDLPPTSGKQLLLLTATGQLLWKASSSGNPKPSYNEGYTKSWAFSYKVFSWPSLTSICLTELLSLSRSEEHTSELQSRETIVCRLL